MAKGYCYSEAICGIVCPTEIKRRCQCVKLYIPNIEESNGPQLISINHADAWLLDALPGIGATSAQRIVDYHEANGPFVTVYELMLVPGIGESTFENIKDFITVE